MQDTRQPHELGIVVREPVMHPLIDPVDKSTRFGLSLVVTPMKPSGLTLWQLSLIL